jgi:hypothetical protein
MAETASAKITDANAEVVGLLDLVPLGKSQLGAGLEALTQISIGEANSLGEAEIQVLEGVRYEYALPKNTWRLASTQSWGAGADLVIPSKLQSRQHCGILNPGLATGTLKLSVLDENNNTIGTTNIEVRSRKLGYRTDYQWMLNDITNQAVCGG